MLRACLASLVLQETNNEFTFEIVVIDNNSTDDTGAVLQQLVTQGAVPLRTFLETTQGRVHARHRGLDEARGEWIANFDDDEVAEPTWLLELMRLARSKHARSVGGKLLLRFLEPCERQLHPRIRRALGESVLWEAPQPYTRRQGPGAGNQLLHRTVFEEVGRYDLSYQRRGEDTDLYRRICEAGIVSWFSPTAVAYHLTPNERIDNSYLKSTFLHDGWCFSRRDVEHFGPLKCSTIAIARLAKSLLIHGPISLLSSVVGKSETALAHRMTCYRDIGYARGFVYSTLRNWIPQTRFLAQYGFDK